MLRRAQWCGVVMAAGSKGRGPLVADRRYAAPKQAVSKSARGSGGGNSGGNSGGGNGSSGRKRPAPRRSKPKRGLIARFVLFVWHILWSVIWRVLFVGATILAAAVIYFYVQLPAAGDLLDGRARGSVTLEDRNGDTFAWRGETFGGIVTVDKVSPNLKNAVIATEDKRFYHHFGVSPRGIISAISINLAAGRGPFEGNGGSTITQQTAKLLCLGVKYDPKQWKSEGDYEDDCRSGGLWRKIKEIPYALAMEVKYSKDEILTIYFNRAYLGAGARGFEAASQRYFGKSAHDLTPAEAAMLAGLLKAPSKYAPTANLKRAQDRAAVIIGLMQDQGYLTKAEADDALAHPAQLSDVAARNAGGAFADWVMEDTPSYLGTDTTEDVILKTTLDQRIQTAAEDGLAAVFDTKVKSDSKAQAAIIVMSADGAVRAMVGGRQVGSSPAGAFNRATQALRQTGSSFKPFVYAAALDLGWSPMDFVEDTPLTINIRGSGPWTPSNYDHQFKGLITLAQALQESRNIPAVRVSEAVGREAVRSVAQGFGLQSDLALGPALALGASEATLLEMTGAYAGILNGGSSVTPYGIESLTLKGESDPLVGKSGGMGERVVSEHAAQELIWMMEQVVNGGTGMRARLDGRDVAGKTGTTSEARDAWFIGFTADYVTGVWMGYDDNTPLAGVTGGGIPADIWHEVMTRVEDGLPATPLPVVVPEARLPPAAQASDPNAAPQPGTAVQGQAPGQTAPGQANKKDDPITAILKNILGKGN
jgi:penicillin-binding protein 1A